MITNSNNNVAFEMRKNSEEWYSVHNGFICSFRNISYDYLFILYSGYRTQMSVAKIGQLIKYIILYIGLLRKICLNVRDVENGVRV